MRIEPHRYWKHKEGLVKRAVGTSGDLLEIGCGINRYGSRTEYRSYVGLDLDRRMRPDVVASATHLPFRGGSFDWVIALDVIEHVAELNLCLRECRRVLRTGGSLVVVTPNFLGLGLYDSLADPTHVHRFTWWSLERALRRNGFELTDKMQLLLHSFIPFSDRFPGFLRVLQQSICVVSRRSI